MGRGADARWVFHLEGPLHAPHHRELRRNVRPALRRGVRHIVLDLRAVSAIDAAGVGELVRAYNMASAAHGLMQIVHANGWVRETLERAGLFRVLSAGRKAA
jgi:anti-anti-sigma factor